MKTPILVRVKIFHGKLLMRELRFNMKGKFYVYREKKENN